MTPRSIARPACFGESQARPHADAGDDEIGVERAAALERDPLAVDRRRRVFEMETTPCSSCSARMKSPSCGPSTRSIGRASGATTWTSMSRVRSDAATSSPMKLAPMTTHAARALRCVDDRAAIGERAQSVDMRLVRAGNGQSTGSAPVASSSRS